MKNLVLAISTVTLLSTNAFALSVSGADALNLRTALVKAGAEVNQQVETSFIKVTNLSCHQEGGFVLMPLKCTFDDNQSTQQVDVLGEKASNLDEAMEKSGIKFSTFRAGELSRFSIEAKSIICSTSFFHGVNHINCEIK